MSCKNIFCTCGKKVFWYNPENVQFCVRLFYNISMASYKSSVVNGQSDVIDISLAPIYYLKA